MYEINRKITSIKTRLQQIKQYKEVLAIDGLKPDAEDKRLESELIVKLLRLEKQLNPPAKKAYQGKKISPKTYVKKRSAVAKKK